MNKNFKVCVIVPAHNEEKVIGKTLKSLSGVIALKDVYVVNDGSKDRTAFFAKKHTKNVLSIYPNTGKANAINKAIAEFSLPKKYQYIMPLDADTQIAKDFFANVERVFAKDKRKTIACVCGKVVGRNHNWITMYRVWEYEVTQAIHKNAQSKIGAISVCPGCATVFRSEIFKKTSVPIGTITEDMDLTFEIHRKKLGRIVYASMAKVITQDPRNIRDLAKQLDRWYTGFWQCLIKHNIPWQGQLLDFEVALLALDGIFNGLLVLLFLTLIPFFALKNPFIVFSPIVFDLGLFFIPTLIFTSIRQRKAKYFLYIPNFYLIRCMSSLIFFKSFLKTVFARDLKMGWRSAARYQVTN